MKVHFLDAAKEELKDLRERSIMTLEERVAALERQVAALLESRRTDWLSTVGMFSGDEVMKQIDEATKRIREADRKRARTRKRPLRQVKK